MRYLKIAPQRGNVTRSKIGIVCIVRNVDAYLEEWLDFHFLAGIDHVLLYDNLSNDGTSGILEKYTSDRVTRVAWGLHGRDHGTQRYLSRQLTAYAHAITTFGMNFSRLAFIDVDEFLIPVGHNSIPEALDAIGPYANISLPWIMFGHSGHIQKPEGSIIKNYTRRAITPYAPSSPLLRFKCIVDPCKVTVVGVHRFETTELGDLTANAVGSLSRNRDRKKKKFFVTKNLQLNHYYALSQEELQAKIFRGPVANSSQEKYRERVMEKIFDIERATVSDERAIEFQKKLEKVFK